MELETRFGEDEKNYIPISKLDVDLCFQTLNDNSIELQIYL